MQPQHGGHAVQAVLGRVTADAGIHNPVIEPLAIQQLLQIRRVGLFRIDSRARGEAVAEADQQRSRTVAHAGRRMVITGRAGGACRVAPGKGPERQSR